MQGLEDRAVTLRRLAPLRRRSERALSLGALLTLGAAGGCAIQPPSSATQSGFRLTVTMSFANPMQANNYYFCLINLPGGTGSQNAVGPVPIVGPPELPTASNGFATGYQATNSSGQNLGGFTQFVLYTGASPASGNPFPSLNPEGINLYAVPSTGANVPPSYFTPDGIPNGGYVLPNSSSTALGQQLGSPNTLEFSLDLGQLVTPPNQTINPATVTGLVKQIGYLQINIISTNTVSNIAASYPNEGKQTDSMGNNLANAGEGTYLDIPVFDQNGNFIAQTYSPSSASTYSGVVPYGLTEPTGDVYVYPPGIAPADGSVDLVYWTVQLSTT